MSERRADRDGTPRRVRVTSPRTEATRTRVTSVASEIDAQTRLGEVYVTSLIRSQLRLAVGVLLVLAVTLGALPLIFHLVPEVGRLEVVGIPLPWLLLTVGASAEIVTLGCLFVRKAERNEDDFTDLFDGR
ncbi:MAG: hypothetical protein JWP82_2830 [Humibacillus sp.]|nr:hypothetical protein [Humibacillus sp.]